jgi:hypothetical protein
LRTPRAFGRFFEYSVGKALKDEQFTARVRFDQLKRWHSSFIAELAKQDRQSIDFPAFESWPREQASFNAVRQKTFAISGFKSK